MKGVKIMWDELVRWIICPLGVGSIYYINLIFVATPIAITCFRAGYFRNFTLIFTKNFDKITILKNDKMSSYFLKTKMICESLVKKKGFGKRILAREF